MNPHRFVGLEARCQALVAMGEYRVDCNRKLTDPVHDLQREDEGDDAFVTVRVSRELMAMLQSGWSDPVRVMIADNPNANHVEMIAVKHECEKSE